MTRLGPCRPAWMPSLSSRLEISTWRTDAGDLDVLTLLRRRDGERASYTDLIERASGVSVDGIVVTVAALDDIIASKEFADRPKDREALSLSAPISETLSDPLRVVLHRPPQGTTNQLGQQRTLDRREQDGEPPSLLVPVLTAGRMLGIGRTKVYELVGDGELELVHIGCRALIPVDSVHSFAARLRTRQANEPVWIDGIGVVKLRSSPPGDSQPPAA